MSEALKKETTDGDHVGAEEGDEVERDYDVEGYGAAELDEAEDEGEEGGGEDGVCCISLGQFFSFRGEHGSTETMSRCSRAALNKEIVGWRSPTEGDVLVMVDL